MGMFQTTRWSIFLAGRDDPDSARLALQHLCQAYWRPAFSYVRRLGYSKHEAEDLTQSFFAGLIERRLDARADPLRGRFRTLLLTSLKHHVQDVEQARHSEKRGGGLDHQALNAESLAAFDEGEPDQVFLRQWALTVLERAMRTLEQEARQSGKAALFDALRDYLIEMPAADDYARLAAAHGMRSNSVAVAVHRLRQKLRKHVQAELAETVDSADHLSEEMEVLRHALGSRTHAAAQRSAGRPADVIAARKSRSNEQPPPLPRDDATEVGATPL